jgi:hypothetical protein
MATNPTNALSDVVDVIVYVSPMSAPRRAFDTGLILGPSTVIPSPERTRLYNNMDEIATDGFVAGMPEYDAAQIYFSQKPRPTKVMLGRRFAQSILTFAVGTAAGTGYHVGDILSISTGGTGASFRVSTVDSGTGAVTGLTQISGGYGYSTGNAVATIVLPAGGTGCTINILTVGTEAWLSAAQGCRADNAEWYSMFPCGADKNDIITLAGYVETATPTTTMFYNTDDADVKNNVPNSVADTLRDLKYSRSHGVYSTKSLYTACSIMAYAMRNNNGLANSAYTLKFKQLPGVTVEDSLSPTQIKNIESQNCNVYINRGYYYDMYEQGVNANGQFFDEVINLDVLSNNIQLNIMDVLYQAPKVPQTEPGVTQLVRACNQACANSVRIGFLAPGKWNGTEIMSLKTGDYLATGFLVQAEAINDQSQADRDARKAPPIYVAVKEAGAIHSVTIGVYVNR